MRQVKEDEDYELNERKFLFCYKSERNLQCFDNFIKDESQFKFFPLLLEFFLIQLNTIVFDIKVDENNEEGYIEFINSNIWKFILSLVVVAIIFFIFTFSFGLLRICLNNIISKKPKKCCSIKCEEISNIILNGTFGIVIVNSFYSLFAFYFLFKGWENNFLFYIPILMNKFYFFVFNNHCTVYTDNDDNIDYFSSATLLSIYLFIWEQIIKLMKKLPIKFLLYFQILISIIIISIFILSLLMLCCFREQNCCFKYIYDKFIKIEEEDNKKETDINTSKKSKCKKAIQSYNFPPLVGLNKVNFPSYINPILQCLSQTEPLTNDFLRKNFDEINGKIALGYFDLIQNLWSKNIIRSSSDISGFLNIIKERDQSFKLDQPGNYKEFIIFILDNIHNDLKEEEEIYIDNTNKEEQFNEYDQKSAYNDYKNKFSIETSIISDLFFGTNEIKEKCLKLGETFSKGIPVTYKYEKFNCLKFPLDEIGENQNYVTLEDCFKYNQEEKQGYCNYCNEFDSKKTSKIFIAPNILILILDRGKEILSNVKLEFQETIDITQFVIIKEEEDEDKISYNLYAVLTHNDQNKFFAYCKSPVNKKWYIFEDDKVNIIKDYRNTLNNCHYPDILFYQKN